MLLPDSVESEAHEVVHEVVMGGDIIEEGLDFVGFFVGGYGLLWSCCFEACFDFFFCSETAFAEFVVSSMEQTEMQGEMIPVFLPMGVSGVGWGVVMGYRESQNGEVCKGIVSFGGEQRMCLIGELGGVFLALFVCLCLLALLESALRRGRRAFEELTGAKHRVRWRTRGVWGDEVPPQKTPRQRSARQCAFYAHSA